MGRQRHFVHNKMAKSKTKEILDKERKIEREAKAIRRSEGSNGRTRRKAISKPAHAHTVQSVTKYGTTHNALNSHIAKFGFDETQAALMAWAHTVANPRGTNPHPVPLACAPGASGSVARMFQVHLYGVADANAAGAVFIGANCDAWQNDVTSDVIVPENKYLSYGGVVSYPVHYTNSEWVGGTVANSLAYPQANNSALTPVVGLKYLSLPTNFVPSLSKDSRYTMVSCELRARPVATPLDTAGDLAAFNRKGLGDKTNPAFYSGATSNAYNDMLAVPPQFVGRDRCACANWPSDKWLTVTAIPNTYSCFGQWEPTSSDIQASKVGFPQVAIIGAGLETKQQVEFEVVYNYAIYGTQSYQTGMTEHMPPKVDQGSIDRVVQNGMVQTLDPMMMHENAKHPGGVAAVANAESKVGRAPSKSLGSTVKDVAGWVQTGAKAYEAIGGTSLVEDILEVAGMAAAML